MVDRRIKTKQLNVLVVVIALVGLTSRPAHATAIYDITAPCISLGGGGACGPLGVLTTAVGTVTGSMTLSIPDAPIAGQSWNVSNVLSYSVRYGSFQISSANSTLSNSVVGNNPLPTTATAPFSAGDGFLVARYTPDPTVFLNITLAGLDLVQNSFHCGSVTHIDCQAAALGLWSRESTASPEPVALLLLGSGLLGLGLLRRK